MRTICIYMYIYIYIFFFLPNIFFFGSAFIFSSLFPFFVRRQAIDINTSFYGCLQSERSFQKQPTIFLNRKKGQGPKRRKPMRYSRNVGLGFKTPREVRSCFFFFFFLPCLKKILSYVRSQAIEGTYIDKKCPFTGNVSIRGRILTGVVQKMKMQRTIVIRRDYLHYIRKYNRFEKRHRNMSVHLSPCFRLVENFMTLTEMYLCIFDVAYMMITIHRRSS